ncbi:MAG: pyruvate:ferredoxin (flavodoxin) oxidoreductase [Anaerolineales bacterium]|nr:pyruvate:ferredoxin (flavodoxin) oxidoreductase [Anaerolineales bacterium]
MSKRPVKTIDGNYAAASVAFPVNEVVAIYPITPSSPMGEWADQWAAEGKTNIWGTIPLIQEMQSEAGAAGAVHGALQAGSLTTTFTASQGLLLMIPNMFKIAGELTPSVFHVAARSVAAQALSIFGEHSDVMAARSTGFAMLASASVQEVIDMGIIAQAATLESRIPFIHFFDGFRTSHEVSKVEMLTDDDIRAMIDDDLVHAHRARGLNPDKPVLRGTAQNPDVFFQGRESVNPFYTTCPGIVQKTMDKYAKLVGRQYHLFDYIGAPDADRVIVLMGSGADATEETVEYLNSQGEKVGLVKIRLYRPFSVQDFMDAIPASARIVAALDRTKEPGSAGEPLYQDVITAVQELGGSFKVIGGRYGLSSKEFTPAMIKGVYDEMKKDSPKNHFTIGINDDLSHTSLDYDPDFSTEDPSVTRAVFYGLGSDGTVGANKNSIKIIGEETDFYAQGHFVYDSKKSGSMTVSHLRFGPKPIKSSYQISKANFVACHQFTFLEKVDVLHLADMGATFLLNSPYSPDEIWDHIPYEVQKEIIEKKLKFYVVDGYQVAEKTGMGSRINTVLQACFFGISGVLPKDEALAKIKEAIKKTYGKRGDAVVQKNYAAVDMAMDYLYEVKVPAEPTSQAHMLPPVPDDAPEFVKNVLGPMIAKKGDDLPVSALPNDGTYPTATTQYEKRNVTLEIPSWDPDTCIQCGKCTFVCPHAVIRGKVYDPAILENAPETFKSVDAKFREFPGTKFTIQISPEDCTGCGLCIEACPAKNKTEPEKKAINFVEQIPVRETESANWEFFMSIPDADRTGMKLSTVKNVQLLRPLFEFSGACAGCGETPYVKLLSQLFGDRAVIANATGCSSIYGGNLPTTPYATDANGRGPAWNNSLFEDNAEFGLGMRLTLDKQVEYSRELVNILKSEIGADLADALLNADQSDEAGIQEQRARVEELKAKLAKVDSIQAKDLLSLADKLVKKSVWILGGDGWAYDIGYGGVDHVLASGRNINILVLDTEVYSNTGGQASKATPRAATAKFAYKGKDIPKKDLGMIAMAYGYVYVARVAMGANDVQTLKAFSEAEAFNGPSLIIAYSHCISHGIDMRKGLNQQKLAVESGVWPLYRYNPTAVEEGKNPLTIDSKDPSVSVEEYAYNENRYRVLTQIDEDRAERLMKLAKKDASGRWDLYKQMAQIHYDREKDS